MGFHPSKARLSGQLLSITLSASRGALQSGGNFGSDAVSLTIDHWAPIFSFGLSITALDLAERWRETWVVRALAETGSASLTGYLLHSVMLSAVVSGWGLGYYGALGSAACLAVALATFVTVVILINLWKLRFRFGPDEWLLRSLVELRWLSLARPVRNDPV